MSRQRRNYPDMFCYVYREFIVKGQKRTITPEINQIYQLYFNLPRGDQDKFWATLVICKAYPSGLHDWYKKRKTSMPVLIPMIWRQTKDHLTDCYPCRINVTGYSTKNKYKIEFSNLNSAMWFVRHTEGLPIPFPPDNDIEVSDDDPDCHKTAAKENYVPDDNDFKPYTFSQAKLNGLVRDLSLSKDKAEL